MTLEEKITHLKTTSMEQARAEGNAIIDSHQEALDKVFEDHKAGITPVRNPDQGRNHECKTGSEPGSREIPA